MDQRPKASTISGKRFLGINVVEGMRGWDFFNLYGVTLLVGILIIIPAIIQPAFLREVIKIPRHLSGSINSGLQNMSQLATLLFIGYIGALSDRYGRVILAFIGFFVTGGAYLMFGYTIPITGVIGISPIAFVYFCRFMVAVGFVMTFPQFSTLAADYTTVRDRGKAMAYNGFMLGAGGILVFNVFSQLPKRFGLMILFYLCAVIALIGATWLRLCVKDRLPEKTVKKGNFKELIRVVRKSLALKVGYVGVLITRADSMILGTLVMVWAVESAKSHGLTPLQGTAIGGAALGIMMIVSVLSNPIIGPLIDRFGSALIIILGLLLDAVGFVLLGLLGSPFTKWLWLPVSLIGVGQGTVAIASNAICADAAPKGLLGTVMGGKNTMAPVGTVIFLQLAGLLFDKIGPAGAFYFKAAINLAAFAWVFAVRKGVVIPEEEGAPNRSRHPPGEQSSP